MCEKEKEKDFVCYKEKKFIALILSFNFHLKKTILFGGTWNMAPPLQAKTSFLLGINQVPSFSVEESLGLKEMNIIVFPFNVQNMVLCKVK